MRQLILVSALATGLIATVLDAATARDDPSFGLWMVASNKAIVELAPCETDERKACGRIVWLARPFDAQGNPKIDALNPDERLRGQPLCGVELIADLAYAEPGKWVDGKIYNPREGSSYASKVSLNEDGTLGVRGFLGLSLFGKTQSWTRVYDDRGGCPI